MSRSTAPRPRYAAWVPIGLVLLAAGCGEQRAPSAELFPLEAGHRWTYRQLTEWEDGERETGSLVLSTLPGEDYEGKAAFRRRSNDGVEYWLRRDASGIYRVAMRHELEDEPKKDAMPRYVLKEPLAAGNEWQSTTVAYLLKRRQGFPAELKHEGKAVVMRYAIEALKETVSVPAGRFEGCLRLRGEASMKLYADAVVGWRDMPLTTTEWYCPGPGLVKLERAEPTGRSSYLTGGKYTLELLDWKAP